MLCIGIIYILTAREKSLVLENNKNDGYQI